MKLGEIVVHMNNYNFSKYKFHQNQMKNIFFVNSSFFCSEFQSVSRIVKIVHSGGVCKRALTTQELDENVATENVRTWKIVQGGVS